MIIDSLAGAIPDPQSFGASEGTLARLRGYLQHFRGAEPVRDWGQMQQQLAAETAAAAARCPTEQEFFAMMDDADINLAAVYTERYSTRLGVATASNDRVAEFVARRPDRLLGIAGIDPWEDAAADEVQRAVRDLGLRGVIMSPFKQALRYDDARMGRVYAHCEALGVPVFLHTGINWFAEAPYDAGHPRGIDEVARSFPDLKIVAVHAGWPWVQDMMMVAWRHPNVYVDISAHRPKHFAVDESGWGALLYYGSRMVKDKVLFASTWTLLGVSPKDLIAEVRALPLKDDVVDRWLGGNAARLYGLD